MFTCPDRGVPVITGILYDPQGSELLDRMQLNFECPVCDRVHSVDPRIARARTSACGS
jgi:hypothetical protein